MSRRSEAHEKMLAFSSLRPLQKNNLYQVIIAMSINDKEKNQKWRVKNMKKRILSLVLVLAMSVGMMACEGESQ